MARRNKSIKSGFSQRNAVNDRDGKVRIRKQGNSPKTLDPVIVYNIPPSGRNGHEFGHDFIVCIVALITLSEEALKSFDA
jgi:hypothetical protein